MRLWPTCLAFLLVGSISGCGKPRLEVPASFEVGPVGNVFTVDPTSREQNIQVTGSATGAPVNTFIYLDKNKTAAQNEIFSKKFATAILAKQDNTETIGLEATIPANETAVVHVTRAAINKVAHVELKITNK